MQNYQVWVQRYKKKITYANFLTTKDSKERKKGGLGGIEIDSIVDKKRTNIAPVLFVIIG